jgi:hypothetical protein
MEAEQAALITSGPRRGKQITYALLEERVPAVPSLTREEALAALTQRYFTSHGPATLRDYVWWSGLTTKEARAGLALTRSTLVEEPRDGTPCYFAPAPGQGRLASPLVHLLPNYDEFLIAYKDRESLRDARQPTRSSPFDPYAYFVIIDGRLRGTWRRTLETRPVVVTVKPLRPLTRAEERALMKEGKRYAKFLGAPVTVRIA